MKKFKVLIVFALVIIYIFSLSFNIMAAQTPEQVYKAIRLAIKNGNFDRMTNFIAKEKREEIMKDLSKLSPDKRKERIEQLMLMLKDLMPVEYKILKIVKKNGGKSRIFYTKGKSISLFEENKLDDTYGKVTFVKEKGRWKLLKESWKSKPFDETK